MNRAMDRWGSSEGSNSNNSSSISRSISIHSSSSIIASRRDSTKGEEERE